MRTDDSSDFDDLGYTFFNSTGVPDATVSPSLGDNDYREYEYNIESLEDFTAFAIKLVLQSADSANPPLIENFRAIALST